MGLPVGRLEIMIRRLRRDFSDQRISEGYNILLGDLGHPGIRALRMRFPLLRIWLKGRVFGRD